MDKAVGILLFAIVVVVLTYIEVRGKLEREKKVTPLTIENKKKLKKIVEDFFAAHKTVKEGHVDQIASSLKINICRTEAQVGLDFIYGASHSDGWRYQYVPLKVSPEVEKEHLALACAKTLYPQGNEFEWEYMKLLILLPDFALDGSKTKDIAKTWGVKPRTVVDRIAAA